MLRCLLRTCSGLLFVFFLLFSAQVSAQLIGTISTSKEEQLLKKYNHFSMVETEVDLAVGPNCVAAKNISDLPLLFFNEAVFTTSRAIEIHFLNANGENMVLEHNKSENDIFFVKSRFVTTAPTKSWFVLLDGHSIVLKNCSTKQFLALNNEGDFYPVKEVKEASRFELIHHF